MMSEDSTLLKTFREIIERRGRKALELAIEDLLGGEDCGDVSLALRYFANTTLNNVLPVFPALISLSSETAEGKVRDAASIGASIILLAGAADVHDDIIDRSKTKNGKKTVYGKFGMETALLAGDALLIRGLNRLQRECCNLPKEQGNIVADLVSSASLQISNAEILETRFRKRLDFSPDDYFAILELKASVPEANMKIGAVLGGGDVEMIKLLGDFGRSFGVLSLLVEEFLDLLEFNEFRNRLKYESLPLPVVYAFQDSKLRKKAMKSISNKRFTKKTHKEIVKIILDSDGVSELEKKIGLLVQEEVEALHSIESKERESELSALLLAMPEYLKKLRDYFRTIQPAE